MSAIPSLSEQTSVFDVEKFTQLVHYIIDFLDPSRLGKTKLNKILWFSEREMYIKYGHTLTGETYLKFPEGPVAQHLLPTLQDLMRRGLIVERQSRVCDCHRTEYVSLSAPDISSFSQEEVDIVARTASHIAQMSARQISTISHDRTWDLFKLREPIKMVAVLASQTREPTPDDIEWALS
ncbi:MAG: SocA family protein [Desulfovibrionaceae bacterium]|nr:SocA family protein [Desulfovibrionaceae bacterium]